MESRLYEYAILRHPKTEKDKQEPSSILKAPSFVMAKSDKEVGMKAAREIPDTYLDKLEEVEICIRPF